ncbi:hypothetical protein C477_10703 [Haloterrigena salina JCM 13891]|uniref:Uncharacterized protein n=1 Tax=Haloterrigena salina JCM 13891 TaxID=1227488 RepID=M0C5R6_9EURY|nr:DUF6735 family protein [Haloterrigena salina]ELZ18530.1 hypothetical protein C477_10703 [Haloterrigena salina JCM 13891]
MGHRALVAYRRPDQRYDLRYSHWGGEAVALGDRISAETPLGDGDVDGDLLAEAIDRDRLLIEYLDPCCYEALYVVEPGGDYRVTAYRVCWLEWPDGRDGDRGAIVTVENDAADRRVRTWFRATKTTLADVVEMGVLSWRAARTYLEARICEDEDGAVYTYGASDTDTVDYAPSSNEWFDGDGQDRRERTEDWHPDEDLEGRDR